MGAGDVKLVCPNGANCFSIYRLRAALGYRRGVVPRLVVCGGDRLYAWRRVDYVGA